MFRYPSSQGCHSRAVTVCEINRRIALYNGEYNITIPTHKDHITMSSEIRAFADSLPHAHVWLASLWLALTSFLGLGVAYSVPVFKIFAYQTPMPKHQVEVSSSFQMLASSF
jgi:hypothetical protein